MPRDIQLAVFVLFVVEVLDDLLHPTVRLPHRVNALIEALGVQSDRSKPTTATTSKCPGHHGAEKTNSMLARPN